MNSLLAIQKVTEAFNPSLNRRTGQVDEAFIVPAPGSVTEMAFIPRPRHGGARLSDVGDQVRVFHQHIDAGLGGDESALRSVPPVAPWVATYFPKSGKETHPAGSPMTSAEHVASHLTRLLHGNETQQHSEIDSKTGVPWRTILDDEQAEFETAAAKLPSFKAKRDALPPLAPGAAPAAASAKKAPAAVSPNLAKLAVKRTF